MPNPKEKMLYSFIEHSLEKEIVCQRAYDGYINATQICKVSGKLFTDWNRLTQTKRFLYELNSSMEIPINELIQTRVKVPILERGIWIHPQAVMNLAQWASPKLAVAVSKWVLDWFHGNNGQDYSFPYHIRRYMINRKKIPATHFSMLDQMAIKLMSEMEQKGYIIPTTIMSDISLGRIFSKELRDIGHDPDSFPTYIHDFDDGKRPPILARLYPHKLMTEFNAQLNNWIRNKSLKYFQERDSKAIPILRKMLKELPDPNDS